MHPPRLLTARECGTRTTGPPQRSRAARLQQDQGCVGAGKARGTLAYIRLFTWFGMVEMSARGVVSCRVVDDTGLLVLPRLDCICMSYFTFLLRLAGWLEIQQQQHGGDTINVVVPVVSATRRLRA